jgi:hypothetical protein
MYRASNPRSLRACRADDANCRAEVFVARAKKALEPEDANAFIMCVWRGRSSKKDELKNLKKRYRDKKEGKKLSRVFFFFTIFIYDDLNFEKKKLKSQTNQH